MRERRAIDGRLLAEQVRRLFGDVALPAIRARAVLWPVATWLLPVHLPIEDEQQELYLARAQALPAVPSPSDWRSVLHGRTQVERVQWTDEAHVIVLLRPVELSEEQVGLLRSDGWELASGDDRVASTD
jgi:hypothetical protein